MNSCQKAEKLANAMVELTATLCRESEQGDTPPIAITIAYTGTRMVAETLAKPGELSNDHILIAALLVSRTCTVLSGNGNMLELSADTMGAALDDFTRLTGRDPTPLLSKHFLKVARPSLALTDEQKTAMGQFLPPAPLQ